MTGEQELRLTSDAFLARLARLQQLEDEKRLRPPGSQEMLDASAEVEALTQEVLDWARRQTGLAEQAAREGGPQIPIEAVPPREPHVILADSRNAERQLMAATPNTAEWASRRADVERLRDEYRRAFEARRTG